MPDQFTTTSTQASVVKTSETTAEVTLTKVSITSGETLANLRERRAGKYARLLAVQAELALIDEQISEFIKLGVKE